MIISGPLAIAGITLTLLVKVSAHSQPIGANIWFSGLKQPINVVVSTPSILKAFDIEGKEIPVRSLLKETPDLANLLGSTRPT